MKVLISALLLCSTVVFADSVNVNVDFQITGQYQKTGERELVNKTNTVTGSARVSGRIAGESVDQTVQIPTTNVDVDSVLTVNADNTVRLQNLKEGTDNTYHAKVKLNKDGSIKEIKIKGRAMEKSLMTLLQGPLADLKTEVANANVSIDIDDFVCKADQDLVGVYNCGTRLRMQISARVN